jgi:hypothetical protein
MPPSPPPPKSPTRSTSPKPPTPRLPGNTGTGGGGTSLRLNLGGPKTKGDASPKRSSSPKPPTAATNHTPPSNNGTPPTSTTASSSSKKRKYTPPTNIPPHLALASFARLHHQTSHLAFFLTDRGTWACRGESILYITDTAPPLPSTTQLAVHLRGNCHVDSVQAETVGEEEPAGTTIANNNSTDTTARMMEPWKTSFDHIDPLEHVLIKPASSYTETDVNMLDKDGSKVLRYDADTQSSRGAAGMTTGLRAASIGSNMGELRMSIDRPIIKNHASVNNKPPSSDGTTPSSAEEEKERRKQWFLQQWHMDLEEQTSNGASRSSMGSSGRWLHQKLQERSEERRKARLKLVAERLAEASDTEHGRRAFKIRIQYHIVFTAGDDVRNPYHAGGLHVHTASTRLPPHIYTTSGVFGDHEGTRNWLPCLDSASYKHRASQQLTIQVTAPMREGLQIVGCGEDFGVHETWLHYKHDDSQARQKALEEVLGSDQIEWMMKLQQQQQQSHKHPDKSNSNKNGAPHVIPPDNDVIMSEASNSQIENLRTVASMDAISATQLWASTSWMPVPARCLGFAIGPFKVVDDPEYFGLPELDLDDEENEENDPGEEQAMQRRQQMELEREKERIDAARLRGEGIRQAYFAPVYERKDVHRMANTMLLAEDPSTRRDSRQCNVEFQVLGKTNRQICLSKDLEDAVKFATAGVPHRALSLMRDILALPAYRTAAYTQIWIPQAVNGGHSTGALHSCPEVLGANCFLGGAILDAGLLPPVRRRIPYFQGGGRVLQMLQARCAIRGWIMATLPLGGQDDVGGGYIHGLIESFMMSFYERGHGASGEGKSISSDSAIARASAVHPRPRISTLINSFPAARWSQRVHVLRQALCSWKWVK